ncbi:MAG TPA: ubiquinol-cytochrome c reductase cytochrome b subunit [Acidimicrobiales bacterium]|nr:ubiquinol-cytochrome c reductase cytochrome b subunit [Acidimicrobiales bacterium]
MSTEDRAAARKRARMEQKALDWVDDRMGSSSWLRSAMDKIFPDHWSFMVGEIAMYCLVILIITGVYLTGFYHASNQIVVYHGPYKPLDGVSMTEAYESVINISFSVRAGLVMRQIHHWAAVVFLAAVAFHMCRIFFTGAFRKPRELNWTIGLTLLLVVMLEGYTGYSLPDDLLSGTGVRVVYSIIESIPFIGTWLDFVIIGTTYPGLNIEPRLFVIHEFLFPAVIVGLLTAHLMILWRQKHTDFPAPGKTEHNIVGSRLWPQYTFKSAGLFMVTFAVLSALGGLVQINPIWIYGPYVPYAVSAGSQPDWYVGWLDGAVRLWPHWEFRSFGHEIANPFFPGILMPGIVFTILYAWPAIDKRLFHDFAEHNLLDRPRDNPVRTAIGVAGLTFFTDLTLASATDLLGNNLIMPFERLIEILQIGAIVAPPITGIIAYKVCKSLLSRQTHPIRRPHGGVIIRTADGGYHTLGEIHGDGHGNGHGNGHAATAVNGGDGHAAATEEGRPALTEPVPPAGGD